MCIRDRGNLREYADAFRNLMNIYGGGGRTALSLQLKETAAMLERILGDSEEQAYCIISEEQKGKLYDYLRSESINAVSYTHLDVYKRQALSPSYPMATTRCSPVTVLT